MEKDVMRAAPLALSGLLALILAELLKLIMPVLLTWLAGLALVVLKIGLAVVGLGLAALAVVATIFVVRRVRRRQEDEF